MIASRACGEIVRKLSNWAVKTAMATQSCLNPRGHRDFPSAQDRRYHDSSEISAASACQLGRRNGLGSRRPQAQHAAPLPIQPLNVPRAAVAPLAYIIHSTVTGAESPFGIDATIALVEPLTGGGVAVDLAFRLTQHLPSTTMANEGSTLPGATDNDNACAAMSNRCVTGTAPLWPVLQAALCALSGDPARRSRRLRKCPARPACHRILLRR
jgi:hypothetical protein